MPKYTFHAIPFPQDMRTTDDVLRYLRMLYTALNGILIDSGNETVVGGAGLWFSDANGIHYPYDTSSTGNVGIGMDSNTTDDLAIDYLLNIYSTSAAPQIKLTNASGTARDPTLQWLLGATPSAKFTVGVDDSDSDKWKISNASTLSSGTRGTDYGTTIYISDRENHRLKAHGTSDLAYISKYGTQGAGDANFDLPRGICTDGTYLYVCDTTNDRIKKHLLSDYSFVDEIGSNGSGDDQFDPPIDICTDGTYLYIADEANDRIKKHLCSDLSYVSKLGSYGTGDDNFNNPRGICHHDGFLYVSDSSNARIKKHNATTLAFVSEFGSSGSGDDQFSSPNHLITDGTHLFICDAGNHRIKKHLLSDLSYVAKIGSSGSGDDEFNTPWGIEVDGTHVYVSDSGNDRLKKHLKSDLSFVSESGSQGSGDDDFEDLSGLCITRTTSHDDDLFVVFQDGSYIENYPPVRVYDGVNFIEDSDTASDYVRLKAPVAIGTSYTLTLPDDVAASTGHLYSDTGGQLEWGQNVNTTASPTFVGLTLSGLTQGSVLFAGASGVVSEDNDALFFNDTNENLILGGNTQDGTATNSFHVYTGTAPGASITDGFILSSTDFAAGNACPYFRTENGTVIGLNQSLLTTDTVEFDIVNATTKYQCASTDILAWDTSEAGDRYTLFIGSVGGGTITTARYGIGIGQGALAASTEGYYNICIGWDAGKSINTGGSNICIGTTAGDALTSGSSNIAIGAGALSTEDTESYNIAIGGSALGLQNGGGRNIILGYRSGLSITTADDNIGIGDQCYRTGTMTGGRNVALGTSSCAANTTGIGNVGIGYQALQSNTTGSYNVAIGYQSLVDADGIGSLVAIGYAALQAVTSATHTTAIGSQALMAIQDGTYNTSIGYDAGGDNVSGDYNTYVGSGAGGSHTGNNGTFVGRTAGGGAVGVDGLVCLGYFAGSSETNADRLYIDNRQRASLANDQALALINGTFAATTAAQDVRMNANVGIGTATFGTNADFVFSMTNGTAPTTNPADQFQMYAADIVAGESAPHFETEHGDVIKLYQQAHIADASTSHAITDPNDTPATADDLRDDLVANAIPDIESALDALGTKINAIYTALENAGFLATS